MGGFEKEYYLIYIVKHLLGCHVKNRIETASKQLVRNHWPEHERWLRPEWLKPDINVFVKEKRPRQIYRNCVVMP